MFAHRRLRLFLLAGSAVICSCVPLAAQEAGDPPLDPAAKKAVGELLDRLFQGALRNGTQQPTPAGEGDPDRNVPLDRVDERAIVNREHRTLLLRAGKMLAEGEQTEGLRLLQYLLDADEDSLILTDDGRWASLHALAEGTLLHGPSEVRARYRRVQALAANELLMAARTSDRLRDLAIVTRRYFATAAGEAAANELAARMLDAGQPAEAAYWFQRLLDAGADVARDPQWRRQAARVLHQLGRGVSPGDSSEPAASNPQVERPGTHRIPEFAEWRLPFGGPGHAGRTPASTPVLIERWRQPITDRPQTAGQIGRLVEDLQDVGQACIPAALPLAVDGKIVFRTLRGLSIVEAATGRQLWEAPERVSVERLLAGEGPTRPGSRIDPPRLRSLPAYEGNGADQYALTNLLFRDGVYGMVTSDGERVFVLEDHATLSYRPPGYYRGQPQGDDPQGRDWESNRIAAFELSTGRRLWSIGGPEQNGPFSPALAGTLFQGPPVVEGDELFVIGEHQGAEVLYVLDRRSGQPLWTQMLTAVTAEIQHDLVRRWWPAMPAVGKGVVICPTTVGWVIAVDRHERRIRWATRLTKRREPQRQARQSDVAMTVPLNSRWRPSAPVLIGDRVVFTPPEFPDVDYHTNPQVVCLDGLTGAIRWTREKDAGLYLGAVVDDLVLLVGTQEIVARNLAEGQRRWSVPWTEESGPPSGRGVVSGPDFLVPLQSGQVWRVRLADGTVTERMTLNGNSRQLGNLLVYRQRLYSQSALGVSCFEDRQEIERLIARAVERRLEPAELLPAAKLLLHDGNAPAAARLLRDVRDDELTSDHESELRALRRRALAAAVHSNPGEHERELEELKALAESSSDRLQAQSLRAAHLLDRGDREAAFDVYWQLARVPAADLIQDGATTVRVDRWLGARLAAAWAILSPDERDRIDELVRSTVESVRNGPPEFWAWWAQVLAFHPEGHTLDQLLAEHARRNGRLVEAELRLRRLLDPRHRVASRIAALEKLVTLLDGQNRSEDAAWFLAGEIEAITAADPAAAARLRDWSVQREQAVPDASLRQPFDDWSSEELLLTRTVSPTNRQTPFLPVTVGDGLPSMNRLRFLLQPGIQRLHIETADRRRIWETPLRSQSQLQYNQNAAIAALGQLLLVVHRDVLHGVSLPDRELLWTRPLSAPGGLSGYGSGGLADPPRELADAAQFQSESGLMRPRTDELPLPVSRPEYVACPGRNTITTIDPLTGETLWSRTGIRPRSLILGTRRHVLVIPPQPLAPFALHSGHGAPVELPELVSSLTTAIDVFDDGLVTLEVAPATGGKANGLRTAWLRLVDPETGTAVWDVSFPEQTRFSRLDGPELLALEPGGKVRLIDWSLRRDRTLAQLDPEETAAARSIHAVADRRQVYLSFNSRPDSSYRSDIYASLPVNGLLVALDRLNGGIAWQATVKNQYLLRDHLQHLPVLLFHVRCAEPIQMDIRAQKVEVLVLDKWSGRKLLNKTRYVSPGSVRSVEFDLATRTIDLEAYRERLRIQPAAAADVPASD